MQQERREDQRPLLEVEALAPGRACVPELVSPRVPNYSVDGHVWGDGWNNHVLNPAGGQEVVKWHRLPHKQGVTEMCTSVSAPHARDKQNCVCARGSGGVRVREGVCVGWGAGMGGRQTNTGRGYGSGSAIHSRHITSGTTTGGPNQ